MRKEISIDQGEENKVIKKDYRDSTAIAEGGTSDVFVLKKKHIDEVLKRFPSMNKYMRSIA